MRKWSLAYRLRNAAGTEWQQAKPEGVQRKGERQLLQVRRPAVVL